MIVTRFAPSPTGYLHVGGARTALFSYLFAKKNNGKFILRIEDTDESRNRKETIAPILSSLRWLGLNWDEGPEVSVDGSSYYQSNRKNIYTKYANKLISVGQAYRDFSTTEELEILREKYGIHFDRKWVEKSKDEEQTLISQGIPFVIRYKNTMPIDQEIAFKDLGRGNIAVKAIDAVNDFVIYRNGTGVYNFACVVDDALMSVSHVIRGDDHLSNTPKQIALYNALGFDLPQFCHIPMILGPDKKKLSKRSNAASVEEFKDLGYLPSALINQLARLGWANGNDEVFTIDELLDKFSLDSLSKGSAVFDYQKLTWLNKIHQGKTNTTDLKNYFLSISDSQELDFEKSEELVKEISNGVRSVKEINSTFKVLSPKSNNKINLSKDILDKIMTIEEFTKSTVKSVTETLTKEEKQALRESILQDKSISIGINSALYYIGKEGLQKRVTL